MFSYIALYKIWSQTEDDYVWNIRGRDCSLDICITVQVGLHSHSSLNKSSNWDHLSTIVKWFYQSVNKFIIAWFQIIMISLCVNVYVWWLGSPNYIAIILSRSVSS